MRFSSFVATLTLTVAASAHAKVFDAKELAKYDLSYQKCEVQIPQMKGRRDASYLNLYRIKADAKSVARLDKLRTSADYAAEKKRASAVVPNSPRSAASAAAKLGRECQALWGDSANAPK